MWCVSCRQLTSKSLPCLLLPRLLDALLQGSTELLADAISHDPREVLTLQPRQVFGKEREALVVGARHTGKIRALEGTPWAEKTVPVAGQWSAA